ncbi:hypothetical protein ACS0TY_021625 [Phlomoides rotata]
MDGYNPYSWNQIYNQNAMVYPPQQEEFGYDNRRNFDYHYQMPQVPSYYQDWSHTSPRNVVQPQHDFQLQQEFDPSTSSSPHEERPSTDKMLSLIYKEMKEMREQGTKVNEYMKNMEAQVTQMSQQQKTFESQISQLAIAIEKLQEEEEGEEDEEQIEEDPSECKSEDDNLIIKDDQEECPLMDMCKNEQENQEASKEELKSEMRISKPLNSSIYTLYDDDVSIDFILPLDSFDHKKEVEKSLGILEKKGEEWKEMLRSYVKEKLCIDGMSGRSTFQGSLIPFEAQRLRYNGKEDRYPWPFR